MGVLRQKMIEEMKLRNFSERTQQCYLSAVVGRGAVWSVNCDFRMREGLSAANQ
jgi:hypothetical protein